MDREHDRFWSEFHGIRELLDRGAFASVRQRLENLRAHSRRLEFDPARQIDYSYAVILLQTAADTGDLLASASLLEELLETTKAGNHELNPFQIRVELAAALILLNDFEKAVTVAEVAAAESGDHPHAALAFQNLGHALTALGRWDAATTAYLRMIDVALRRDQLTFAGIAAEGLSRVALRCKRAEESATWHDIAEDTYKARAPQHLKSLAGLTTAMRGIRRLSMNALPPQAREVRALVPIGPELGEHAGDHLDLLNIDLGALRRLADRPFTKECRLAIPLLGLDDPTSERMAHLIMDEADAILGHEWAFDVIMSLVRELWPHEAGPIEHWLVAPDRGLWSMEVGGHSGATRTLVWRAKAAGPVLFGPEITALGLLLQAAYKSRRDRLKELSFDSVTFIALSERHWPRPLQTYVVLQGQAMAGGHGGPARIAESLLRGRLARDLENLNGFTAINFTPDEARDLAKGGLIALLASEIAVPGVPPPADFGTTPLNEINIANPPNPDGTAFDETHPGFVIDREYNSWFFAPSPVAPNKALYGANNELRRDHFEPLHQKLPIAGSLRAKHYTIPVVDVRSPNELAAVRAALDEAVERLKPTRHVPAEARVWFRGQTRGYLLGRSEVVCRYLYGLPSVDEPSLPGAAPRRGWNYLKIHSFLSVMLQGLIYRRAAASGEDFQSTHQKWLEFVSVPAAWDLAVMLLAQHYGVPTHGIDITEDLDVALWFATNRFTPLSAGTATYRSLTQDAWPEGPEEWPVIYVILPVTHSLKNSIRDVDALSPFKIDALRPRRQAAAFFMGAHGLHRNRLAEALVCVLRLAPGAWNTQVDYTSLFPSEKEDESYAWMLDLKERYATGDIGQFLAEVPRYV